MKTNFVVRYVLALLLLTLSAYPQTVKNVSVNYPVDYLVKQEPWANLTSGTGKEYIFVPVIPGSQIYITLRNNNATNTHTASVRIYSTLDPQIPDTTNTNNNIGSWELVAPIQTSGSVLISSTSTTTIGVQAVTTNFIPARLNAKIAIQIFSADTQAGAGDTLDIIINQSGSVVQGVGIQGVNAIAGPVTNPIPIGAIDSAGNLRSVVAGDPGVDLRTGVGYLDILPMVFSAGDAAWNRMREAPDADAQDETGITATVGFLYNGTTYDRNRGVPAADAQAGAGFNAVGLMLWNGATWDRARGDGAGALLTSTQSQKATYSAVSGLTPAVTATDIFGICGSATKTVRVTYLSFSGTATAASALTIQLIKRSTADTTGTFVASSSAPNDANNAAPTIASVGSYTANPGALGTTIGGVRLVTTTLTSGAGAIPAVLTQWIFGVENDQEVVLRGVASCLYINQGGVTPAGEIASIAAQWTEE